MRTIGFINRRPMIMNNLVSTTNTDSEFWIPKNDEWVASKKTIVLPNGITLAYNDFGAASGIPLLMIHGYTDSCRTWSLAAPYLAGRRLIAIDLRGHGNSSVTDTYSVDELASDVAFFIAEMGFDSVDVIGHSLGSITSQVLAAFYPEKVKSVILLNSTLRVRAAPGDDFWEAPMNAEYPLDPQGELMAEWFWNPSPIDPDFLRYSMLDAAATDKKTWQGVPRALSTTDLTAIQPLIKARLMIMWGDLDPIFDLETQLALRAAHPAAEILTFEGCGHNPHWERPKDLADAILAFTA
jgi:pimeloyl-ACP methyl ester carboxylesterase